MINNSSSEQRSCLTISKKIVSFSIFIQTKPNIFVFHFPDSDDTLSSSTISSTKTASSSSIEQTLPMSSTKLSTLVHRFISRKIFKPETCFVVKEFHNLKTKSSTSF